MMSKTFRCFFSAPNNSRCPGTVRQLPQGWIARCIRDRPPRSRDGSRQCACHAGPALHRPDASRHSSHDPAKVCKVQDDFPPPSVIRIFFVEKLHVSDGNSRRGDRRDRLGNVQRFVRRPAFDTGLLLRSPGRGELRLEHISQRQAECNAYYDNGDCPGDLWLHLVHPLLHARSPTPIREAGFRVPPSHHFARIGSVRNGPTGLRRGMCVVYHCPSAEGKKG